jgi:hypothetical protein
METSEINGRKDIYFLLDQKVENALFVAQSKGRLELEKLKLRAK